MVVVLIPVRVGSLVRFIRVHVGYSGAPTCRRIHSGPRGFTWALSVVVGSFVFALFHSGEPRGRRVRSGFTRARLGFVGYAWNLLGRT